VRDYRISKQWPAVEARAVVPYDVFRHRMMDGWSAIDAAMTPARTYVSTAARVREAVANTPGITTTALAATLDVTPLQMHFTVARECREGRMTRTLVAKGAKGQRPVYAVEMAEVAITMAPVVTEVVLVRRAPTVDYGSPFARRAS
jgi:hypothetical protein